MKKQLWASAAAAAIIAGTHSPAQAFFNTEGAWNNVLQFAVRQINAPGEFEIELGRVTSPEDGFAQIETFAIRDGDGVWLRAEQVVIDWSPSSLLTGDFFFKKLTAKSIDMPRAPITRGDPPADSAQISIAWPRPPVALTVENLSIERFHMGGGMLAQDLTASISGSFTDAGDVQAAALTIKRLEGPTGEFAFNSRIDFDKTDIKVTLNAQEGPGGLVAAYAGIPPSEPVSLLLKTEGTGAALPFWLDGEIGAIGAAKGEGVARWTGAMGLTFDGSVIPYAQSAPEWRAALGEAATLKIDIHQDPDDVVRISAFDLESPVFGAKGSGSVTPKKGVMDVAFDFAARDVEALNALTAPARLAALSGSATAKGRFAAPEIHVDADIGGVSGDFGALRSGALRLDAQPAENGDVPLTFALTTAGLALNDPAMAEAIGDAPGLSAKGAFLAKEGALALETLALTAATLGAKGSARYDLATGKVDADLTGDAARVGLFTGGAVDGAAGFALTAKGASAQGVAEAALKAGLTGIVAQDEKLAAALGSAATIDIELADKDGATTIRRGRIEAAALSADIVGAISVPNDTVDLALNWRAEDPAAIAALIGLEGLEAASGSATIGDTLSEPAYAVDAALTGVAAGGAQSGEAHLTARAKTRKDRRIPFDLTLATNALSLGDAAIDSVVGAAPGLKAAGLYDTATGLLTLESAALEAAAAQARADGSANLTTGLLGLDLDWTVTDAAAVSALIGAAGFEAAEGRAALGGTMAAPALELNALLGGLHAPGASAASTSVIATADTLADGTIRFDADILAEDPDLKDKKLNAVIGSRIGLTASGIYDGAARRVTLEGATADIPAAAARADLKGGVDLGAQTLDLTYALRADKLSAFGPLAPEKLLGVAKATGAISGGFAAPKISAKATVGKFTYGDYRARSIDLTANTALGATTIPFSLRLKADSPDLGDPKLGALIGTAPTVAAEGSYDPAAQRLTLTASSAKIAAGDAALDGRINLKKQAVLVKFSADVADLSALSAFAGKPLSGSAAIKGSADGPFSGPAVKATVTGADLGYDVYGAQALRAEIDAGPIANGDAPFDVTAAITAARLGDPKLEAALGRDVTLAAKGAFGLESQRLTLTSAKARMAVGEASASGSVDLAGQSLALDFRTELSDLSPLSGLAGKPLSGALSAQGRAEGPFNLPRIAATANGRALRYDAYGAAGLSAQIEAGPLSGGALPFDLSVKADAPQLGDAKLESAIGGAAEVKARGSYGMDTQRLRLDAATARAAAGSASVSGDVDLAAQRMALSYRADAPDLSRLSALAGSALAGGVQAEGRLEGAFSDPASSGVVTARGLSAAGQAIGDLTARYDARNLASGPEGTLKADGTSPYGPVMADMAFALKDGAVRLDPARLSALGASLAGGLSRSADGAMTGGFDIDIATLAHLAKLGGMEAQGAARGRVDFAQRGGAQAVDARLSASDLRLAQNGAALAAFKTLSLEAQIEDALGGDPRVNAALTLGAGEASGVKIAAGRALARGALSALSFEASGEGGPEGADKVALAGRGRIMGGPIAVTLERLDAAVQEVHAVLARPLEIAQANGGWRIDGLDLGIDDGRVSGAAAYAPGGVNADLRIDDLPLTLARLAGVKLIESGRLNATINTQNAAQGGAFDARISGLRLVGAALDDPLSATANGRWSARELTAAAEISAPRFAQPLRAEARLPLRPNGPLPGPDQNGPLSASLNWRGEMADVLPLLPAPEHVLTGPIEIAATVSGTMAAPNFAGGATLTGARYEHLDFGVVLPILNARADLSLDGKLSFKADAADGAGGTLTTSGEMTLKSGDLDIAAQLNRMAMFRRDDLTAQFSGEASVSGRPGKLEITARVRNDFLEYRLVGGGGPSLIVVDAIPTGDSAPPQPPAPEPTKPTRVKLDVRFDAPSQIFVRGRGLDSEWGGSVSATGFTDNLVVRGLIERRRGWFDLLGRPFEIPVGEVRFTGPAIPFVNVRLQRSANGIEGWVDVSGPATDPQISFGSNPGLPSDEVLPRLLFGRDKQSLSAIEGAQLAAGVATLMSGKPGAVDFVRGALGVDVLRLDSDSSGSPTVSSGKYVADGVFVGAKQNLDSGKTSAIVEIEVIPNVAIDAEIGPDESSGGVFWKRDY